MRSVWLFYHRRKNLFVIRPFVYKYKAPKPIPSDLNKNKKTKETVSGAENGKEGVIIIKFGAPKPYVKRHSKTAHLKPWAKQVHKPICICNTFTLNTKVH